MLQRYTMAILPCGNPTPKKLWRMGYFSHSAGTPLYSPILGQIAACRRICDVQASPTRSTHSHIWRS